jgi:hypothetical protein
MHHKATKTEIGKQLKTRYPQRKDIDSRSGAHRYAGE